MNLYNQQIFTPLTEYNPENPLFLHDEMSILTIIWIVFAIYFIIRRKDLTISASN